MLISVETSMYMHGGTLISSELNRSYPAALEVLRLSALPFGLATEFRGLVCLLTLWRLSVAS